MGKHIAVIGANYGDEGKGRVVDYFAKKNIEDGLTQNITVRFSGSNNAAHTVYIDPYKSNVFKLLGSSSYRYPLTYLSKHVSVDVIALKKEIINFNKINDKNVKVVIDPRCQLILPYDVMINQIKEIIRGNDRHGSTGNGLNESITRSEFYPINVGTIAYSKDFIALAHRRFVKYVNSLYMNDLATVYNHIGIDYVKGLKHEDSIDNIHSLIIETLEYENISVDILDLKSYNCIFEGSQGLLLDEYSKSYPYVTRSNTGVQNLIDISREFDLEINEIVYVSRPYLSRHGSDPGFTDNSEEVLKYFNIVDQTNVHNDWQGSMRYDFLKIFDMRDRCDDDFEKYHIHFPNSKNSLAITCLDQQKEKYYYKYNNTMTSYYDGETTFNGCRSISDRIIYFNSPWN